VLRPEGILAVCDGDYATITVALGQSDPLQACIEAVKAAFINDVWLVRRLPTLLRSAGFEHLDTCSHGYLQTSQPDYMLTLVDRGADTLASNTLCGAELAAALRPRRGVGRRPTSSSASSVSSASSPASPHSDRRANYRGALNG
jgi:hypothetical protein